MPQYLSRIQGSWGPRVGLLLRSVLTMASIMFFYVYDGLLAHSTSSRSQAQYGGVGRVLLANILEYTNQIGHPIQTYS